jgi:dTDP-4-dehydrorhamnose 3,5-epimerase
MKFTVVPLKGAYLIELEPHIDKRGYFARTFCNEEFKKHKLVTNFTQMSTSFNYNKGQIRGMHYQEAPYEETKVVRCTRGAVYDVIVDLRKDSDSFNQYYGVELSKDNGKMLYIPKGFAHGYKTLEPETELFYMMDQVYSKVYSREIDYNTWSFFK